MNQMQAPAPSPAGINGGQAPALNVAALQQQQQPAPTPQGMQGLDPKLVAAMMAQYAKQKVAEENQRQMALQAPQPQGTVVDNLLKPPQEGQGPQGSGIQQLLAGVQGGQPPARPQGIDATPTQHSFKEGGIVGYAGTEEDGSLVKEQPQTYMPLMQGDTTAERQYKTAINERLDAEKKGKRDAEKSGRAANNIGWLKDVLGMSPAASNEGREGRREVVASAEDPTTWTGGRIAPEMLAQMRVSTEPEYVAAAKAYDTWAAQNPEKAAGQAGAAGPYNAPAPSPGSTPRPYAATEPPAAQPPPSAAPPAVQPPPAQDYTKLTQGLDKLYGLDQNTARADEERRYAASMGKPDTSVSEAQIKDYAERKQRLAPRTGIMDLLGEYAKAPGQQWWQTGVAGGQSLADLNESLAVQRDALSDKSFALQQGNIDKAQALKKEGFGAGTKAGSEALTGLTHGVTAGAGMRNADVSAGASMYGTSKQAESSKYTADLHLAAAKAQAERAATAGDVAAERQALAEIKASLVADQATVAGVQKLGPMATEVDMENARRAAKRIQEATAYLHSKQVPGAAVPVAAVGGGAKFVSPPATGNVRP